ncbi:hypothetical protein H4R18_002346 [Coemansia javaensis]|uniref:Uncharacterized protein n=1 Tax=Coemansia javaensis TaxID=2761396 RepID=A0A9W8LIV9_9FUNG|nr:hypothetical protein H4R18_002346 [Coemansia javaensis]
MGARSVTPGFWPRLFRRTSGTRPIDTAWPRRPHADSTASAATAVDLAPSAGAGGKGAKAPPAAAAGGSGGGGAGSERRKQRRLTRRPIPEAPAEDAAGLGNGGDDGGGDDDGAAAGGDSGAVDCVRAPRGSYSAAQLGIAPSSHEDGFWRAHDQRLSVGCDDSHAREILDAMVDDVPLSGGWRMEPNQGTFNDVLDDSTCTIHPIVLAFARAHIEHLDVVLGPDHIWLAILQSLRAVLRRDPPRRAHVYQGRPGAGAGAARDGDSGSDSDGPVDLHAVWGALRDSSSVPGRCYSETAGRDVQLFAGEMHGRHMVHGARGAAPLAMAAAAAGGGSAHVDYGRIEVGRRLVAWQPRRRSTNPQWVRALGSGPGVRRMRLAGSLQAWSSLCVLARQIKETLAARHDRAVSWWAHRVHLLVRDLADYFAAQDEATGDVPAAWRKWLALALFDGHSGAPRGACLDGWLSALFAADADARLIHDRHCWSVAWDLVPSGVDLLRISLPARDQPLNMYSGFVGTQQLCRDPNAAAAAAAAAAAEPDRALAPLVGWALDG